MGPNEAALKKVFDARPGQMRTQAEAWEQGATDLRTVSERLRAKQSELKAAWPAGEDGEAATAAFEALATYVDSQANRMDQGAKAYGTAAEAITTARGNYHDLPDVPDGGGSLGDSATPQQVQAADKANASGKAAREQKAAEYLQQMGMTFQDAQSQMAEAAPYDAGVGGGETGPKDQGYGGSNAGSYSSPGSGGTGPYSTSTSGTYAGGMVGASALGGRPLLGGIRNPSTGPGRGQWVEAGDGATADGLVGGTVPDGTGSSAGAGGATVGTAGLGGGTGSAMGAGGAAALVGGGKGLLGRLGGAGGAKPGVPGGSATARTAGSSATAKGATLGGRSAGGSQGVLGGRSGSASGASAQGARGATAGGQQAGARGATAGGQSGRGAGAGGRAGGGTQAGGRTAGSSSTARSAGSGAGGRANGAAGAKAAPGSNTTGSRSTAGGGRGAAGGSRGTGPGSSGQGARGAQRGTDEKSDKRKAMVMAEDWMDDDDVAPDVLQ